MLLTVRKGIRQVEYHENDIFNLNHADIEDSEGNLYRKAGKSAKNVISYKCIMDGCPSKA